jgi:hypothetical protein
LQFEDANQFLGVYSLQIYVLFGKTFFVPDGFIHAGSFYNFDAGYWFFCSQGYSSSTDYEFKLYVKNNSVKVVN